jgi:hypothetical protein
MGIGDVHPHLIWTGFTMEKQRFQSFCCGMLCVAVLVFTNGCDKQDAKDAIDSAGDTAANAADSVKEGAEGVVAEGKEIAGELSEGVTAFLTPMKEKMGNLESLKSKPEELKTAVSEMITSIEEKTSSLEMPEALSTAIESIKEKLVGLKDYLEGEYDQSGIDKKVDDLMTSVKSGLGMSAE